MTRMYRHLQMPQVYAVLEGGAIPIYLGAPNIGRFVPGGEESLITVPANFTAHTIARIAREIKRVMGEAGAGVGSGTGAVRGIGAGTSATGAGVNPSTGKEAGAGAGAGTGTPKAGTPEAGTSEAGTPEAGTPEAGTGESSTGGVPPTGGGLSGEALYNRYTAWKGRPYPDWFKKRFAFAHYHSMCRLCRYVYHTRKNQHKWDPAAQDCMPH